MPQRNSEEQEKLTGERLKGSDDELGEYYRLFGDFARLFREKEGPIGGARREENAGHCYSGSGWRRQKRPEYQS